MEYIGKSLRQDGMDTVQSHHTIEDIKAIASTEHNYEILVRINPIHDSTDHYCSSKDEIDAAIDAGADILMLPYFKSADEVRRFVKLVDGRCRVMPLVETPEANECIDEILEIDGIDEIFIGLNDMSLGYGKKFMFELLADGTVEALAEKFKAKNIPFGFGGLASLEGGLLPGHLVLKEHYRLGSTAVILSRSFCNTSKHTLNEVKEIFEIGVKAIRNCEASIPSTVDYEKNKSEVALSIKKITGV
jgi:hypothetical protein